MEKNAIHEITVSEFKTSLKENPNLCVIDVRENNEWEEVHLPFSIHLPKDKVPMKISEVVPDKTTPIYLHCRKGMRSMAVAQVLKGMGYENVYSLQGGIDAWIQAECPVVRKA